MIARQPTLISVHDYLELEAHSPERHEYMRGQVYAMTGGSMEHARIAGNVVTACNNQLGNRGCGVFGSDLRVKSPAWLYAYPDVSVVCGEPILQVENGQPSLLNPQLIVEVLSPSTEGYDQGNKFHGYRAIPTLTAYVLIAQDRPWVEVRLKNADGDWVMHVVEGPELIAEVPPLDLRLECSAIYQNVRWPEPPPNPDANPA
jgi:Uma2 family endonuclease